MADNVRETAKAHFGQVFPDLLGQEGEIVDQIVGFADKMFAQFRVLGRHAGGTGVEAAFAHHHATEHDERQGAETELVCSQQTHQHHVAAGFQLAVHLQANLAAEAVAHQRLLRFGQADFRADTGKSHRRSRGGTRAAFGSGHHNQVGLGFGHAGGNGAHTALRHQFYADGGSRIHVLEVEDQL